MPHHLSAKKRVKTNIKAGQRNKHYKSVLKTAIKRVLNAPDKTVGEEEMRVAVSLLDKAATKGIIHQNKAARKKSQLMKWVNSK